MFSKVLGDCVSRVIIRISMKCLVNYWGIVLVGTINILRGDYGHVGYWIRRSLDTSVIGYVGYWIHRLLDTSVIGYVGYWINICGIVAP